LDPTRIYKERERDLEREKGWILREKKQLHGRERDKPC
jgi:hypothetical protein